MLLWGGDAAGAETGRRIDDPKAAVAFAIVRALSLGYVGLAVAMFLVCVVCLVYSFRHGRTRAERNQVQWILLAAVVSSFLIAYLLSQAWIDPATLGRDNAAWPMFGVSLLYTMAYAFSITRYKLMQVEEIINRSVGLLPFSLTAGLLYSGVLLVGGKVIGDQSVRDRTRPRAGRSWRPCRWSWS